MTTRRDRTRLTNRIQGLLFAQGIYLKEIRELPAKLGQMKLWDGSPLPQRLRERIEREWEKVEMLSAQIRQLKKQRRALLREATDEGTECARKLLRLGGIGANACLALRPGVLLLERLPERQADRCALGARSHAPPERRPAPGAGDYEGR